MGINFMNWNVGGIMSAVPYLLECFEKFQIHICGLSEHWLRQFNINFLYSIDNRYNVICKPVPENTPFNYRCSIRSGVALFIHKSMKLINEINTDSDRIVGAEIEIANGKMIYCFAAYLPASSKPFGSYLECLEILEDLCTVYSDRGDVFVLADLNAKVKGPRYDFVHNDRTAALESSLMRINMKSAHVQTNSEGPVCTFFPTTESHASAIEYVRQQAE